MPIASIAEAIVLAVYMPPQAPAPGQAFCTTSSRCSSVNRLLAKAPAEDRPRQEQVGEASRCNRLQDLQP